MPIERTPIIDDDGSGTVGTVFENAWKVELYNQIDAALTGVAPVGYGTAVTEIGAAGVHDVALPRPEQIQILRLNPTGGTITIRSVTPGRVGDLLVVHNVASMPGQIVLLEHSGAAPAGKAVLGNIAVSAPTPLGPRGYALYQMDSDNLWLLMSHDQGGWITAPFSAANFSAVAPMTFTVTAGEVAEARYRLVARTLTVSINLTGNTGGSASSVISVHAAAYGGFSSSSNILIPAQLYITGAGQGVGYISVAPNQTQLSWNRLGAANFAMGLTALYGQVTFEVN